MRLRTSECTQMEKQVLESLSMPLAAKVQAEWYDYSKITAKIWLWQLLMDNSPREWLPGEIARPADALFTLAKARLVAHRRSNLEQHFGCYCLPETSLMPCGCKCKPKPVHDGFQECHNCSICIRCGRYCKKFAACPKTACNCHPAGLALPAGWRH